MIIIIIIIIIIIHYHYHYYRRCGGGGGCVRSCWRDYKINWAVRLRERPKSPVPFD